MQTETTVFTDAVRNGDIEGAKAAYPISRRSWERIEPIAALIEDIDGAVDAREDDFDGPEDPTFTGWHRLEYHLWLLEDLSDAGRFANQLDADLPILADTVGSLDLPPGVLTVGAQELIEEVAAPDGKLSGEEERYSGTDLYDFKANGEGAEALVGLLTPALQAAQLGSRLGRPSPPLPRRPPVGLVGGSRRRLGGNARTFGGDHDEEATGRGGPELWRDLPGARRA